MKPTLKAAAITVAAALMLSLFESCSQRILDFTIISSKNTSLRIKDGGKGPRVTGEDMAAYFLFPLGNPQVKNAVDRAIESAGPGYDALLDGVIYSHYKVFLLFGSFGFSIEGTPIKTSELIAQLKKDGIDPDVFFASHSLLKRSDAVE